MEKARQILERDGYTCVLRRGDAVITDRRRGVAPLLELLDRGCDVRGFSAADKVVGKAAALLYVRLGVSEVWAGIISMPAVRVLRERGIRVSYGQLVSAIRNRTDTGFCPMETAVWETDDPVEADAIIRRTLRQLQKNA